MDSKDSSKDSFVNCNLKQLFDEFKSNIPVRFQSIFLKKLSLGRSTASLTEKAIKKVDDIAHYINDNDIEYLFVSEKSFYNQACLAKRLNDLKQKSIFISIAENQVQNYSKYFEKKYQLSTLEFFYLISKTSIIIFSQGWLFRYHQTIFINLLKGTNKHYVDFMDLHSFLFPKISSKIGSLLKKVWGHDAIKNDQMQKWCEKALFKNIEKGFFTGSINHVSALNLSEEKINKCYFANISINSDLFVTPLKEVKNTQKFVFAGGLPPFDKRRIPEFFSDAQLVTAFSPLLANNPNLKIDVYNNPLMVAKKDYNKMYSPHVKMAQKYQNYNFKVGSAGIKIRRILSKYSFGLMVYNIESNLFGPKHFENIVPTKFYLYIEAGLPVIVSSEFSYLAELVRYNDIGLVCTWSSKLDLIKLTSQVDLIKIKNNVIKFRNEQAVKAVIGLD